jgi:hypothetical protein
MTDHTHTTSDDGQDHRIERTNRGPRVPSVDRRTVLGAGGALAMAGLAGCSLLGGSSDGSDGDDCPPPPDDLSGPVPAAYEGATSEADIEREPGRLIDRVEANYQSEPNGDQRCERCSFYVPDENGDCLGACVRVEGYTEPDGWCEYYRTQVGGGW